MGYFNIGKYKVFYSDDRFIEVNKPFYESLSPIEWGTIKMLGLDGKPDENAIKLEKLQIKKLKEDFKTLLTKDFIKKWVEFEFEGVLAQTVSWGLIYDYFHIHKNGHIRDIRDFDTQLSDDYNGRGYFLPQGETVGIDFFLSNGNNLFIRRFKKPLLLRTILNLATIKNIKGTLGNLEIRTESQILKLGKQIEIIPKPEM